MSDAPLPWEDDPYALLGVPRDVDAATLRAAYFAKVRQHTPEDDPEQFERVAEAYRVLSNPAARAALDAARARDPAAEELIRAAGAAIDRGDIRAAVQTSARLVREHRESDRACAAAGVLFARCGAHRSARAVFDRLVERSPANATLRRMYAEIEFALGSNDAGLEHLRRAAAIDPLDAATQLRYIDALLAHGRPADAETELGRSAPQHAGAGPHAAWFAARRVRAALALGRVRDAVTACREGLAALGPEDTAALRAFVDGVTGAPEFGRGSVRARHVLASLFAATLPHEPDLARLAAEARDALRYDLGLHTTADDGELAEWVREVLELTLVAEDDVVAARERLESLAARLRGLDVLVAAEQWADAAARHPRATAHAHALWQQLEALLRGHPDPDAR